MAQPAWALLAAFRVQTTGARAPGSCGRRSVAERYRTARGCVGMVGVDAPRAECTIGRTLTAGASTASHSAISQRSTATAYDAGHSLRRCGLGGPRARHTGRWRLDANAGRCDLNSHGWVSGRCRVTPALPAIAVKSAGRDPECDRSKPAVPGASVTTSVTSRAGVSRRVANLSISAILSTRRPGETHDARDHGPSWPGQRPP